MAEQQQTTQKGKEERYDRQLRLWGADGQKRLEQAHICVLGGDASGSEVLKNLVLPGIGRFTIVDHKKVEERDLGNNFFVEIASVGQSRAKEVARLVSELNPEFVKSGFLEEDPVKLINEKPDFVKDYTLVIASELSQDPLLKLAKSCLHHNVPLVVLRTQGLIGLIRIQTGEHPVVETKPTFPPHDLRLNDPFPELLQLADNTDYSKMNSIEYSHVPFPIILVKLMKEWRKNHSNDPTSDKEKEEFKNEIHKLITSPLQVNFPEALENAHYSYNAYNVPSSVQQILDDEKAKHPTASSSHFWLLAAAVKKFVDNEGKGKLPLLGSIPDMDSDSKTYISLQRAYHNKADQDVQAVKKHLHEILESLKLPKDHISDDEVTLYCKNALVLRVLRYQSIVDEHDPAKLNMESVGLHLIDFTSSDDAPGNSCWYLALRASELFNIKHGRYPGDNTSNPHDDFDSLRAEANTLCKSLELENDQLPDDHLRELCRYGNSKIHTIAAIVGGVGAQEVIKLITKKWVPCNNTFIFNGVHATSSQITV